MKRKLNCVLLIDDSKADNFFHELAIKSHGGAEKIVALQSGEAALDFLKSGEEGKHPQPDLIFLDINMPKMDGWMFLEEYKKLKTSQKGRVVVVMLTTSLNPNDEAKSKNSQQVTGFLNKPLDQGMFEMILQEHFPDYL